jgi:hypothetical protein
MGKVFDWFLPKRKLKPPPRIIASEYHRASISAEQARIIMAGMARDAHGAQQIVEQINSGSLSWSELDYQPRKKRTTTFGGQMLKLMQSIFGEKPHERL